MKKQVLIILAVTIALVSCQKEVNVKEVSTALYEQMESDYEAAATIEEKEAIVEAWIEEVYTLLDENMGDEYTDTLFSGVSYMFTQEQKQTDNYNLHYSSHDQVLLALTWIFARKCTLHQILIKTCRCNHKKYTSQKLFPEI